MGRGTTEWDSTIPGQDRPPPPCKWLEVEKGLLQAPGDKLGGAAVSPSQQRLRSTCTVGCRPAATHLQLLEQGEGSRH